MFFVDNQNITDPRQNLALEEYVNSLLSKSDVKTYFNGYLNIYTSVNLIITNYLPKTINSDLSSSFNDKCLLFRGFTNEMRIQLTH